MNETNPPDAPMGPVMVAPFREVIHNISQFGEHWSWRCGVQWTKASEGWKSGACRYDHVVDSWDELVEQATAHLAKWHRIAPAVRLVPDTGRPTADARGASIWLGREDWGVVIDALIEHRASAQRRKAGNSESTSDVRGEVCDRIIGDLTGVLAQPYGPSAVPDTGQAREPDPGCQGSGQHCGAGEDQWCMPGCPCDEGTPEPSADTVQAPTAEIEGWDGAS